MYLLNEGLASGSFLDVEGVGLKWMLQVNQELLEPPEQSFSRESG